MLLEYMCEFNIMLQLAKLAKEDNNFATFLCKKYDINKFNLRYTKLLDEFLTEYALNKTEKSD